jgi:hypothetical protein
MDPLELRLERPDVDWVRDQYGRPRIKPDPLWAGWLERHTGDPSVVGIHPGWLDRNGDLLLERAFTRVTTFTEALQDSSALTRWKMRRVLYGAAQRPDYVTGAAALSLEDRDKAALDDLAAKALEAAGPNAADVGTALHGFTEKVDRAEPLGFVPPQYAADVAAYQSFSAEHLRLEHREVRMVCDQLATAGTPDALGFCDLPDPDGRTDVLRVIDVKTGSVDYTASKFSSQLAVYAHSSLYDARTGRRTDAGVDQRWGLVIHLPAGQGTLEPLWLDLQHGWAGALLCGPVRAWRDVRTPAILIPVGGRPQPATCQGTKKDGSPCGAAAKAGGMCGRHQAQAQPAESTPVDSPVDTAADLAGVLEHAARLEPQPEQNGNLPVSTTLDSPEGAAAAEAAAEAGLLSQIAATLAPTELVMLYQATGEQWTPRVREAASQRRAALMGQPRQERTEAALDVAIQTASRPEDLEGLEQDQRWADCWTPRHQNMLRVRWQELTGSLPRRVEASRG